MTGERFGQRRVVGKERAETWLHNHQRIGGLVAGEWRMCKTVSRHVRLILRQEGANVDVLLASRKPCVWQIRRTLRQQGIPVGWVPDPDIERPVLLRARAGGVEAIRICPVIFNSSNGIGAIW